MCSGCGQGSSGSSRRMSGISNNDSGLFPDSPGKYRPLIGQYWPLIGQYWSRDLNTDLSLVYVTVSLPLKFNSPRNKLSQSSLVSRASSATKTNNPSVEDLSDFLSKVIVVYDWSLSGQY